MLSSSSSSLPSVFSSMGKNRPAFMVALRLLAMLVCFSAAVVMITSHETVTVFGVTVEAKYSYTPAFKFLAVTTGIISAYSILVLFIPVKSSISRAVIGADVLVAMLLTASLSASSSVAYVGKKGDAHAGWMPVCDQVPEYCNKAGGALVCNFVGLLLYLVIVFYDIHAAHNSLFI